MERVSMPDLTTSVLRQMGVLEEKTYSPAQVSTRIALLENENAKLREKLQIAESTLRQGLAALEDDDDSL